MGPRRSALGAYVGTFGFALLFVHGRVVFSVGASDWEPIDEALGAEPGTWETNDERAWAALRRLCEVTARHEAVSDLPNAKTTTDSAAAPASFGASSIDHIVIRSPDGIPIVVAGAPSFEDGADDELLAERDAREAAEARALAAEAALGRLAASLPAAAAAPGAIVGVEPADLDVDAMAIALGCSKRTVERDLKKARFIGDAAPIAIGGLDRKRYRWRASQLPAIRAIFAPPPAPVSPPVTPSSPPRSNGRPHAKKMRKKVDQVERKDILARLRDGD